MVRKICTEISISTLEQDLEKYVQKAVSLGATDAKIITTDSVLIDERVRAKCIYPRCSQYGTCANCPPYVMELDQVRKVVNRYKYAIFIRLVVSSKNEAGIGARDKKHYAKGMVLMHKIVSILEAEAFYDGYYLALGFASGSCKRAFCPETDCNALIAGQRCRHSLRARASVEAVGIDAFAMAARIGWDIYPIGASISPDEVPYGTKLGMVLIH
ncbi:MAG: DUF2284 domain-containing protein [Thermodesulfobacteriota bacterium]|jgi:predicted metal-binding protein